jgi:hypothetical protein
VVHHAFDRADASIFLALLGTTGAAEEAMQDGKGLTWPQIRYWLACLGLIVVGIGATIWGGPWEPIRNTAKELGPGIFTAGILASLVEPFFRHEFARDAFLAAFRYVLPEEFKEEVEKIIRHEFIAEKQVWKVKIEKIDSGNVRVTSTYERTFRNKSKARKPVNAWYQVEDYGFPDGPTQVVQCGVEVESQDPLQVSTEKNKGHYKEAKTDDVYLDPGKSAKVWGEAIQYRRANDIYFETFRTPIKNPEIVVEVNDEEFCHVVEFGTTGDRSKSQFENHYTLSGVFFPGQYMYVRWWPKA